MRTTEIAGIGEIYVEHAIAFVVDGLWRLAGKGETAGCDGSEETFEIGELLVGGNELEDLTYCFAFYQVLQESLLKIVG